MPTLNRRHAAYIATAVLGVAGIGGLTSAPAQQVQNGNPGNGGTNSGSNSGQTNTQNAVGNNNTQQSIQQQCTAGRDCANVANQNSNVTPSAPAPTRVEGPEIIRRRVIVPTEETVPVQSEVHFGG